MVKVAKIKNILFATGAIPETKTPDVVEDGPDQPVSQQHCVPPPLQLGKYTACVDLQTRQPVELGRGAFGSTWQFQDMSTGQLVAIKRIQLTAVPQHKRLQLGHQVSAEVLNHQLLRHPHVIRLHHVFLSEGYINCVLELANQSSLLELLNSRNCRSGVPESEARWLFQQLVLALEYLHAKGVCHRDIKLENVLLVSAAHLSKPLVKVADYGCSSYGVNSTASIQGTPCYMSPEMLQAAVADRQARKEFDPSKADIWAAGTVLVALLTGRHPFRVPWEGVTPQERLKAAQRPLKLPPQVSSSCKDLLKKLLQPDPSKRITIAGIKQHSWFLESLPPGALDMARVFLPAPSLCSQSREEMVEVVQASLQVLMQQND